MKITFTQLFNLTSCLFAAAIGFSQPLHQPIPNYTNDGAFNRVGHASTSVNLGCGMMEETMGGVAASGSVHYEARNEGCLFPSNGGIVVEKKNANNGANLGVATINIGIYKGLTASNDKARGIMLDPALNRIYVYGNSTAVNGGFIMCYDMTTLTLVTSFGTSGIATILANADVTGMVLTGTSNNFLISINTTSSGFGVIQLKEYTSALSFVTGYTLTNGSFNYESSYMSLKKAPNGHYFVAGSNTYIPSSVSVKYPMIWDVVKTGSAYFISNSTSPVSATLGQGEFKDYDFYVNPSTTTSGYQFDVLAVGNNTSTIGIYAKYVITTNPIYFAPDASYKNQLTLPGNATPSNTAVLPIKFTRCVMANNGYLSVLGFYTNNYGECGLMGYITPTGTQYTTTYAAPTGPGTPVHKTRGLAKDNSGNILISGCTTGEGYTIIKLSNNYDCQPSFNIKGSSGTICQGNAATLNINILPATPSCSIVWKEISPGSTTIYSGAPVSLLVYPNVTTIYECTVTNLATGCTRTITHTITVLPTSPSFSVSTNTSNSSYFTVSAVANQLTAASVPGFGYAWVVEELNSSNAVICTFSNPSCWWFPSLSTPNPFNGVDFLSYSYSGSVTIANCAIPPVGKFLYGHRYRITRGTWSTDCAWKQQSVIIEITPSPQAIAANGTNEETIYYSAETVEEVSNILAIMDEQKPTVIVAPNPSEGRFTISSSATFESDLVVYDAAGQLVATSFAKGREEQEMDLQHLESGVYFIKVVINGSLHIEKIMLH